MGTNALISNFLLASLPANERARMLPHLEEITLRYDTTILPLGETIHYVYFPKSGIISLLAAAEESSALISCIIGREGMAGGLPLFLGAKTAPVRAIVQGDGTALRMKATDFVNECRNGGALPDMVMRFTYSIVVQLLQSTACYRFHSVDKRLARWLLMTGDRMQSDNFKMTQEFLSNLVGVRREAVVGAAGILRRKNLISYVRGQMAIIDRPGLEAAACRCYAFVRNEEIAAPVVKSV